MSWLRRTWAVLVRWLSRKQEPLQTIQLASEDPEPPPYVPYAMYYRARGVGEPHPLALAICFALSQPAR